MISIIVKIFLNILYIHYSKNKNAFLVLTVTKFNISNYNYLISYYY